MVDSKVTASFTSQIIPQVDAREWFRKQRLIRGGKPTVAGELLFNDEPQTVLPKSSIKIYRYRTSMPEGSRDTLAFDPITIEGCAYTLIATAVSETVRITETIPAFGQLGFEAIKYPSEAIHEVITNAVIHRDYSIKDDIHVRIFDNRIEIQSPGRLPGHVTVENILSERFARNPSMVRILNKFPNPPNKDVGEGLNTTFEVMRSLKLKAPEIRQTESAVNVLLWHEPLASYEEMIVSYLREKGEVNNSKAREICRGESETRMKKLFETMIKADIIERIPGRRGRAIAYRLTAKAITRTT
jgi:ATP-dependent DNA helicase RecG